MLSGRLSAVNAVSAMSIKSCAAILRRKDNIIAGNDAGNIRRDDEYRYAQNIDNLFRPR